MNFDCVCSNIFFTFQFMASESSLLHRCTNSWHPEYRLKWPGIRRTKKGGFTLLLRSQTVQLMTSVYYYVTKCSPLMAFIVSYLVKWHHQFLRQKASMYMWLQMTRVAFIETTFHVAQTEVHVIKKYASVI